MNSKYEKMIENLKSLGSVAVAFSGGGFYIFVKGGEGSTRK